MKNHKGVVSLLLSFAVAGLILGGAYLASKVLAPTIVINQPTQKFGAVVQNIAGTTYNLSGSGVTAAATSIGLQSLTIPQTGKLITSSDLSSTFYVTLEPGSRASQEIVSCTGVTQNANLTATLTGCTRGLLPFSPYTASSTYAFSHAGGTGLIFSNPPQLYNTLLDRNQDATITASFLFPSPSAPTNAATKAYADALAMTGPGAVSSTPLAAGFVRIATKTQLGMGMASGSNQLYGVAPSEAFSSSSPGTYGIVPTTNASGKLNGNFFDYTLANNPFAASTSVQTFNATGTNTWTKPSGAPQMIYVRVWGAGGAGGFWNAGSIGAGGGGGAYSERWLQASDTPASVTVVVGTGGVATTTTGSGATGGQSSFGTSTYYAVAFGGGGGKAVTGGVQVPGGGGGGQISPGLVGGTTDGGDGGQPNTIQMSTSTSFFMGGGGSLALCGADNVYGGGGGSGTSTSALLMCGGKSTFGGGGGGGGNISAVGGAGGTSIYGGGGGGGGGAGSSGGAGGVSTYGGNGGAGGDNTVNGTTGSIPGGGGGGGGISSSAAGGNGRVQIITFY